ncbi:Rid family hydrolase [Pararhodobacter oceanensis]|uniref:Rid family hydrolase n=1 Tax=Pararhodobacter oceanensis TaxID=2172121 RepID=UPI003A947539
MLEGYVLLPEIQHPDIRRIETGPLMSQATICNGMAFLSGQIGAGAPHDSFDAECRAVMARVDQLLSEIGSARSALLHVTVHITDISMMPQFNEVWRHWLDGMPLPARVAVQTPMVDPDFRVAMTCVASLVPQGARND